MDMVTVTILAVFGSLVILGLALLGAITLVILIQDGTRSRRL
jgi:hypothetical protein